MFYEKNHHAGVGRGAARAAEHTVTRVHSCGSRLVPAFVEHALLESTQRIHSSSPPGLVGTSLCGARAACNKMDVRLLYSNVMEK
jgi:hypothetical protein